MGRIGIKKAVRTPAANLTTNKAGGVAYNIEGNPVEKLIFTIGHMANEPQYYEDGAGYTDPTGTGLTSETLGVIQTTQAVLNGPTPEDAFVIARWARDKVNGLKMRTTPLLAFITAAEDARPGTIQVHPQLTRRWGHLVKAYGPHIMTRADEPRLAFAGWSHLFGNDGGVKGRRNRNVPKALKTSIGRFLKSASEQLLAKWAGSGNPSLGDVIRICCPELVSEPKLMFFVNKEAWLAGGEFKSPKGKKYPKRFDPAKETPVLYARHLLGQRTTWDDETKKLISQAHVEWEFALSQFGHDPACKKEIWEKQIKSMGYMAMVKNLRNIAETGVDLKLVLDHISDPDQVHKGGLLPFRYLSAARIFGYALPGDDRISGRIGTAEHQTRPANVDGVIKNKVVKALSKALDASIENLPELLGTTAILVDVSGSTFQPLSGKSTLSLVDAEAILAACWAKKSENAVIVPFSSSAEVLSYIPGDSALSIAKAIVDTSGGATNAHYAIELLTKNMIKVDRIIMLSDMQCWNTDGYYGGAINGVSPVQRALEIYRQKFNKDCWFHCVNMVGTPEAPVNTGKKVGLYSGFSEQLITLIAKVESNQDIKVTQEIEEETDTPKVTVKPVKVLPTIDELRKQYSLQVTAK